jgi:hypothetical protein
MAQRWQKKDPSYRSGLKLDLSFNLGFKSYLNCNQFLVIGYCRGILGVENSSTMADKQKIMM